MPNLEALPQKYYPMFSTLIEVLNDSGRKYGAYMVQAHAKTWVTIQMPTTYEAIPCDSFLFHRKRLYQEGDYQEVIKALNHYIKYQEKAILG